MIYGANLIEAEIVLRTICRQGIDLGAIIRAGRIFCAGQYFAKIECAQSLKTSLVLHLLSVCKVFNEVISNQSLLIVYSSS